MLKVHTQLRRAQGRRCPAPVLILGIKGGVLRMILHQLIAKPNCAIRLVERRCSRGRV
jgi:hypothetical protein